MIELIALLLDKTVDFLIHNGDLKRDKAAPLRLYQLYISHNNLVENAYSIERELKKQLNGRTRTSSLEHSVRMQAKELNRYRDHLWTLSFYTKIYDPQIAEELFEVLGVKYLTLSYYVDQFLKFENGWLSMLRAKAGERDLKKIAKTLEELLHESRGTKTTIGLNSDSDVFDIVELNLAEGPSIEYLIEATIDDIARLEATRERLAEFIKKNCELSDFFAHSSKYGR